MGIAGIKVVHAIPGRVRVKVSRIRDTPALAGEIRDRLSGIRGIQRVEVNQLTGSVLVRYDPDELDSLASLFALAETFTPLFPELNLEELEPWLGLSGNGATAASPLAGGIPTFFGTLNTRVGNVTGGVDLKLLLPLLLLVFGIRGLLVAEKVPFPAWYDLLWFSFGTFFMLNRSAAQGAQ